jgi:hypothetical protein
MLRLIQILRHMSKNGMSQECILAELTEIVDNNQSTLFDLSANDYERITEVFQDEERFNSAWSTVFNGEV